LSGVVQDLLLPDSALAHILYLKAVP